MTAEEGSSKLEETFSSIEEGNALERNNELWKAADAFFKAHGLLKQLVLEIDNHETTITDAVATDASTAETNHNERQKVRDLYKHQANEYFCKSRVMLLKAMEQESESDNDQRQPEEQQLSQTLTSEDDIDKTENNPAKASDRNSRHSNSLTDKEAQQRIHLFTGLFARDEDLTALVHTNNTRKDEDEEEEPQVPVAQQQSSLEDRLLALNKSLPSGFKTSDERMRDINQGLNRLGLTLHSAIDSRNNQFNTLHVPAKSETEQVEDIIAQAKDEVALWGGDRGGETMDEGAPRRISSSNGGGGGGSSSGGGGIKIPSVEDVLLDDAGDSDLLDDEDWDDHGGDNFEFSKEDVELIRDRVNEAQSSLAQLNTMLAGMNEDEDDDLQFDNRAAQKALRDARVHLQQATYRWRDVCGL